LLGPLEQDFCLKACCFCLNKPTRYISRLNVCLCTDRRIVPTPLYTESCIAPVAHGKAWSVFP
jgi:hypothetical protein